MLDYLRRLVRTGAAYTASSVLAKVFAVALLPVYTRYLTRADYGAAEVLLASVVMLSILVRLGVIEALLRFYYRFDDPAEQARAVRVSFTLLMATTTAGAAVAALLAHPLSALLLGHADPALFLVAVLGLWVFTNYELLLVLFRLDERARAYFVTSGANVLLTIALTVWLVVGERQRARGLLLGNFGGSAAVYAALLLVQRKRVGFEIDFAMLRPMLRFGLPTVPAEISIFSLNFVDRIALTRYAGLAEAGLYAIAVKFSQVVIVFVRAFQLAWPPLAYSIREDREARRAYALIVTYYLLVCAWVVVALALLSRWLLRLLVAEQFVPAWKAIPFVATGATLYGLYLVLVVVIGRVGRTELNFVAVGSAMAVNVVLNIALVPAWGIVGAGLALVGAYLFMLVVMYAMSRRLFAVPFEWGRLARIVISAGCLATAGELALPSSGAAGFAGRAVLALAYPGVLLATGFFRPAERDGLRALIGRLRARRLAEAPEDRVALSGSPELVQELHETQDA